MLTFEIRTEIEDWTGPFGDETTRPVSIHLRLPGVLVQVHHRFPDARLLQVGLVNGRELKKEKGIVCVYCAR